ncbi:hypothetical protein AB0M45_15725 [Nocardia sp. NPDC051787]|uniref:hypothetical protein n=1 Tax=Nocardia sp. NPDC051787 TaxID=3155415 RepID=UPI003432C39C
MPQQSPSKDTRRRPAADVDATRRHPRDLGAVGNAVGRIAVLVTVTRLLRGITFGWRPGY